MDRSFKEIEKSGIVGGFSVNELNRTEDERQRVYLVDTAHSETKSASFNPSAIQYSLLRTYVQKFLEVLGMQQGISYEYVSRPMNIYIRHRGAATARRTCTCKVYHLTGAQDGRSG
jgi:hypothetical protein